jgi:7-cyano-7-deazaguanine synthase
VSQVSLVSGGIDSTLLAVMANEEGLRQYPLFIDYGQLSAQQEWKACRSIHHKFDLPKPAYVNLHGFGKLIPSGLTDRHARINEDAFLPGRNLLFLLVGASYAYRVKAKSVAIGLLSEAHRIFPDQTVSFVEKCEALLESAMGYKVKVVAPLMHLSKRDSMELARLRGITGTYSCHSGHGEPCGVCVSCKEIENTRDGGV